VNESKAPACLCHLRMPELPVLLLVLLTGRDERHRLRLILRNRARQAPAAGVRNSRAASRENAAEIRQVLSCTRCCSRGIYARDLCLACYRAGRATGHLRRAGNLRQARITELKQASPG
jgi:hypothetical protein